MVARITFLLGSERMRSDNNDKKKRMPGWLHKSTVALQNPKQFPERLSFISLFIFVAFATAESCLEKERKFVQKRRMRIVMFLGIMTLPFLVVLSHFYPPV